MYQRHPRSRFHKVKANTRKSYVDSLTIIEREVGKRLIRNLTVLDVEHWYEMWRLPAVMIAEDGRERPGVIREDGRERPGVRKDGRERSPLGKDGRERPGDGGGGGGGRERIDRAHNAVAMFRTVLRFCAALRKP